MIAPRYLTHAALLFCVAGNIAVANAQSMSEPLDIFSGITEAVSLHAQSLDEAPANVSIITADEIRRYGYRTLGEALSGVRGFYGTGERTYSYVGVSGFLLPGDYNTRFLVMVNGHNMTENIFGSNNYFGQDFGIDLDLVKRIEIIRGPSSTLYGSNGILATINIVTKSPVEQKKVTASVESASFGARKVFGSGSIDLGNGANLLLSASVYAARGQDFYFTDFDNPQTNFGRAVNADGEKAYHTFASLVYGNWTATAAFSARQKWDPTAPYNTVFNSRSADSRDERDFVDIAFLKETGTATWRWRLYYDRYRFDGDWDIGREDTTERNHDLDLGSSIGSQLTWRRQLDKHWGAITLGAEASVAIEAIQRNFSTGSEPATYLDIDTPDRGGGVFVQHELPLRSKLSLQWGVRVDRSQNNQGFVSPKMALIYKQSKKTTWKMLYGRAFRNPNVYERFYDDVNSQIANRSLKPESGNTFEAVLERRINSRFALTLNGYRYQINSLITAEPVSDLVVQFRNGGGVRANGVEAELNGRIWRSVEAQSSLAIQRAVYVFGSSPLPNSPGVLYKTRVGVPVGARLFAAISFQHVSQRRTRDDLLVSPYTKVDATLSTIRLHRNCDVVLGVRNLLDAAYYDPMGYTSRMSSIKQDGRSLFLKLIWAAEE